ncbi:MAG: hypothetical protein NVV70_06485 [Cellulomonas sp.]|uniref:hypothetical protein n=1 Tax=Cellulomonas sp. TaxID=40001 RepID=UPI002589CD25|nr:hypothetical protein [Cellulomonas sp.]MCR6647791.1 hypothetical protein [Cellulomonas sp.]MCR6703149.1 hypothetical protein [Cellulomonas sp.]
MAFIPEVPSDSALVTVKQLADFINAPEYAADVKAEPGRTLKESLDATVEWVETQVGPLDSVARDYTVYPDGRALVLPDTHLVAVTAIVDPDGHPVTIPTDVNRLAGVITFPGRLRRGEWTVTAQSREHGSAVSLAVKIIAAHLFDVKRGGNADGPRASIFDPVNGGSTGGKTGFAIPARAAQLLAPFRRPRALG